MGPGEASPYMVADPWDASRDCAGCDARAAVTAEIAELYPDPADQQTAQGAIGYCAEGVRPDPARCVRVCQIGVQRFRDAAAKAVAAAHQPKVRAPRLGEEE